MCSYLDSPHPLTPSPTTGRRGIGNISPLAHVWATVYTQVELPPLIPPCKGGKQGESSSLPLERGGLGWGNARTGSDSITCVYTVAMFGRGARGEGKTDLDTPLPLKYTHPTRVLF
jgi:hypothetical protein